MSPVAYARTANRVLAALSCAKWRDLIPDLECVEIAPGAMLHEPGVVLKHVFFPTTAVVSLVSSMKDGASVQVAVVGNEGVVGVCACLGGGRALSGAVVQSGGRALSMSAQAIAWRASHSGAFVQQLLCYTQALFTQMVQTSACNRRPAAGPCGPDAHPDAPVRAPVRARLSGPADTPARRRPRLRDHSRARGRRCSRISTGSPVRQRTDLNSRTR